MAYYNNKKEYYDGDLVLFQRDLATAVPKAKSHRPPNWYMLANIPGLQKPHVQSTKLTKRDEAAAFAKKRYRRLCDAAEDGHCLNDYTFEQHWNDWLKRKLAADSSAPATEKRLLGWYNRYFSEYFSNADGRSMLLNDINAQFAHDYWDWRIRFWSSSNGEKLRKYNPKRRGAKTTTTGNAKAKPKRKSLQMERSALNEVFQDARERGRLQQQFKMKVPGKGEGCNRRPPFEAGTDYDRLIRNLRSFREATGPFVKVRSTSKHDLQRQQLSYFILFMVNSGLRVNEARQMKWSDVKFDQPVDGFKHLIAVVRVSKYTKKKTARYVQTQPSANSALKTWRKISPHSKDDDWVWFGQSTDCNGKAMQFTDLNKTFQSYLRQIPVEGRADGLLCNGDDERRSLYSLRHTYATMRIMKGDVSFADLALNMGCKTKQLEDNYVHVTSEHRRTQITKFVKRGPVIDDKIQPSNPIIEKAQRLLQMGEISEEVFLELAKA